MILFQKGQCQYHIVVLLLWHIPKNQIRRSVCQIVLVFHQILLPSQFSLLPKDWQILLVFLPDLCISALKFLIRKYNQMLLLSFSQHPYEKIPLSPGLLMSLEKLVLAVDTVIEERLSEPEIVSRSGSAVIQAPGRHGNILLVNRVNLSVF